MRTKILLIVVVFVFSGCVSYSNLGEIGNSKNFGEKTIIPLAMLVGGTQEGNNSDMDEDFHNDMKILKYEEDNQVQWQGPGEIFVPILLYHHILKHNGENIYTVSEINFRDQMNYLKNNGYSSITTRQLVEAIIEGANLPQKPILITFDDGNENTYLNAFPVMNELGLTGTVYIIANRLKANGFLSVEQLKELINNGWEVGSHGYTHADLVEHPGALRDEIGESKKKLEDVLETDIFTFAYPFGKATTVTKNWVKQIGYFSGMGLGISNVHSENDIWYLSRRQINNDTSLNEFQQLLSND